MFLRIAVSALVFTALNACTTQLGKANKLMEAGLFHEAGAAYEQILRTDPDNADAKIGLAKARSEIWRKELVSIRLIRMSGDGKGALDRLEELLEKIRAWDVSKFQSGELVSAEEEVRNGRRLLTSMIQQKVRERQPVIALQYWNDYDQIREAKQFGSYSAEILDGIRKEGHAQCDRLNQWVSATSFSFNSIAKTVCASFGGQQSSVALDHQKDFRFSKVVFSGAFSFRNFEGDAATQTDLLRNQIEQKIQPYGLYASESPFALSIVVSGDFVRQYSTRSVIKTHSYKVRIPYQEYEKYEDKEYVNVIQNGQAKTIERPVQKTRPVTRFRMEPRTYSYPATDHSEKLRLNWTLTAKTSEQTSQSYAQEKDNNFTTHDQNLPDIGLMPVEPKFLSVSDWLAGHYSKFAEQFSEKLAIQTGDRFCQAAKGQESAQESAENFSRCAELNPKNVAARAWFTSTLGATRSEVLRILARDSN